ncbi:RsmB/NOP family class I SAM-dependent RNA methyltransferase [Microbaculum marinum]|uniref:RsmB/NOP family class I SAM-dependent RNA methyltransferase n=1 Tax=Microbaculum marinum TaxID=1764581 RepID=A0AAW9RV38_9HYPH
MKHGGIVAAAIEVIADIETRHRPAAGALKDWGVAHRFAGSGDRAAIGNLVFDALRQRASIAWRMGDDSPRALALGAYGFCWNVDVERLEVAFAADRHAPAPPTDRERSALRLATLDDAPDWVRGDYPEWLDGRFKEVFGAEAAAEGAALAERAPVDLRVNTLKATRDKVAKALARLEPAGTPLSATGLRIASGRGPARQPHVEAEAGYRKGWFELQDEGSQLAAALAGAAPGGQVADICAGAGGKTLAIAALMANKGQIYAWDADRHRLAGIYERLQRAGVRNAQVREAGDAAVLSDLNGRMDVVLVDAPCTGTGVWRRRPDTKWRVGEKALEERKAQQAETLRLAAPLVKPGGRLVYVTCSVLAEENDGQVASFLAANAGFAAAGIADLLAAAGLDEPAAARLADPALATSHGLQMSPRRTQTDGFYVAGLIRS